MDLNFEKMNGLIPAIIQDNSTSKVLMLGFMNEEAYRKLSEYIKKNKGDSSDELKDAPKEYKTTKINNVINAA